MDDDELALLQDVYDGTVSEEEYEAIQALMASGLDYEDALRALVDGDEGDGLQDLHEDANEED